jgi:hypothetical protein
LANSSKFPNQQVINWELFVDFEIASGNVVGWLDYRSTPAEVAAEHRLRGRRKNARKTSVKCELIGPIGSNLPPKFAFSENIPTCPTENTLAVSVAGRSLITLRDRACPASFYTGDC